MATTTNAERVVEARKALTRARKLARELELELGTARSAMDGMTGEKIWLGQFWSGVLWMVSTTIQEVGRRVYSIRKETWEVKW